MDDETGIDLGGRLRRLRNLRRISIRSLAEKSGLSANTLSMIENGKTSPSVSTLYKLAEALDLPVTAFFGAEDERQEVIALRAGAGPTFPIVHGSWEGRGGEKFVGRVEPFVLTLEPGADSGASAMLHTGHEFVFCLLGEIEYEVEEQKFLLTPGDSLLFAAHLSHRWRNAGATTASLLIVLSGFDETDRPAAHHLQKKQP
jgi:transcriptional regulator with XRE-family HTH domain